MFFFLCLQHIHVASFIKGIFVSFAKFFSSGIFFINVQALIIYFGCSVIGFMYCNIFSFSLVPLQPAQLGPRPVPLGR